MPRFKFYFDVYNEQTGEVYLSTNTQSTALPEQRSVIVNYMIAYTRKLENFPDLPLAMTVRCERMINGKPAVVDSRELNLPF